MARLWSGETHSMDDNTYLVPVVAFSKVSQTAINVVPIHERRPQQHNCVVFRANNIYLFQTQTLGVTAVPGDPPEIHRSNMAIATYSQSRSSARLTEMSPSPFAFSR